MGQLFISQEAKTIRPLRLRLVEDTGTGYILKVHLNQFVNT